MYPPIIFQMGFSNWQQNQYIQGQCDQMISAIDKKDFMTAYKLWDNMLNGDTTGYPAYFYNITGVTDYYNIMNTNPPAEFDYWGSWIQSAASMSSLDFHLSFCITFTNISCSFCVHVYLARQAIHVGNLPFSQTTKVSLISFISINVCMHSISEPTKQIGGNDARK
jgi:hypothetical protein